MFTERSATDHLVSAGLWALDNLGVIVPIVIAVTLLSVFVAGKMGFIPVRPRRTLQQKRLPIPDPHHKGSRPLPYGLRKP